MLHQVGGSFDHFESYSSYESIYEAVRQLEQNNTTPRSLRFNQEARLFYISVTAVTTFTNVLSLISTLVLI